MCSGSIAVLVTQVLCVSTAFLGFQVEIHEEMKISFECDVWSVVGFGLPAGRGSSTAERVGSNQQLGKVTVICFEFVTVNNAQCVDIGEVHHELTRKCLKWLTRRQLLI